MKIAILGTRGIPNFYGGFEQFAEYLSEYLVNNGHEVYVYCSNDHPYKDSKWKNVNLIHKSDPEDKIGTIGQFVYDFLCITDSRKHNFDIILQLGYTSNSIWFRFLPSKSKIVTNMDGLEWKRTKYSFWVKKFLHLAESWAARKSDILVADSIGIQKYLYARYKKVSYYIPYGANVFTNSNPNILEEYNLECYSYHLVIARLEPENNIEVILDGVVDSKNTLPTIIIGNHNTKFGEYLKNKYIKDSRIIFLGGIYNFEHLNNIRFYSKLYFHGHSVGGTNPSLLEAMASNALICAHKNIFNSSILNLDAFYFEDYLDVSDLLNRDFSKEDYNSFILSNIQKINDVYSWDNVLNQYLTMFSNLS